MLLRSRFHIKASMVLTRADHLFIHNYIKSLNNILDPFYKINGPDEARTRILLLVFLYTHTYIYIYIYIYIYLIMNSMHTHIYIT